MTRAEIEDYFISGDWPRLTRIHLKKGKPLLLSFNAWDQMDGLKALNTWIARTVEDEDKCAFVSGEDIEKLEAAKILLA